MSDAAPPKIDSVSAGSRYRYVKRIPKLSAKWDPLKVLPKNKARAADARAKMLATSTFPDNWPDATIVISRTDNGTVVKTDSTLQIATNEVVSAAGVQPVHEFTLDDGIWADWNKLNYDFTVTSDGASATTPAPVKVLRWHVLAVDTSDTRPGFPAMRTSESNNFTNAFSGAADDVGHSWSFNADSTTAPAFGAMMLNAYSCNYTGHGGVVCGVCRHMYDTIDDVPQDDPRYLRWSNCSYDYTHRQPISTHCVGAYPWLQSGDVKNVASFPSTPKYLMFSICCGGAFEPSLFNAYISRGTRYAIGFRKATLCTWARDYAKSFYRTWVQTYQCDPEKIVDSYKSIWATWQTKLEPVFFGGSDSVPSAPSDPEASPSVGAWLRHVGHVIGSVF
jgi:hypothetical protein